MVAYYFPPDSSSGSYRPFYFARHLNNMDNDIYVLTAKEEDFLKDQPIDTGFAKDIDETIHITRAKVFRPREVLLKFRDRILKRNIEQNKNRSRFDHQTNAVTVKKTLFQRLKDAITDCLASPDPHIGWFPFAVIKGIKLIKQHHIDVIYATGSPWTCFLIGTFLKLITGKPLVLDFRDPWIANPGFLVRNRFIRIVETFMERYVVSVSDLVVANTNELRNDFLNRYPFLGCDQVVTITNGFEEYRNGNSCENERFTLTHAGSLYFSRNPKNILIAFKNLIQKGIIDQNKLRINFLGGISIDDPDLYDILKHPLLEDVIRIYPRLPYEEACEYQANSDVLLLIQPGFPMQVPRKLYEYMAYGTPIVGVVNLIGATAQIIINHNIGYISENEIGKIETALEMIIMESHRKTSCSSHFLRNFENKNLTAILQEIFETVTP